MSVKSLLTLVASILMLNACTPKLPKEMNKDTFWFIIDQAKEQSGTNLEYRAQLIVDMLSQYSPEDIETFRGIAGTYIYGANENWSLWAACKAIEGYTSDDTFLYFCCWLVSQGRDVYMNAAKNPDSLATDETAQYEYRSFEELLSCPLEATKRVTGQTDDEILDGYMTDFENSDQEEQRKASEDLLKEVQFMDDAIFREDERVAKTQIPVVLPRLTAMFGYDVDAELAEMDAIEKAMTDPEAARKLQEDMLRKLRDMGLDTSQLPQF